MVVICRSFTVQDPMPALCGGAKRIVLVLG